MKQAECSETSAYKIQTPGNCPEENIQHTEHGESLKSRSLNITKIYIDIVIERGPGSSIGIATELRAGRSGDRIPVGARFSARPDRPWGPPSLLHNGYQVFPGGKMRLELAADHSAPSSAEVLEE